MYFLNLFNNTAFNIGKTDLGEGVTSTNMNDLEFICIFDGGRNH